ncbi:hypothetical protein QJS10_CPA06g01909 [Acorus calamus]|uniref:Jacalin-type lectin domain-containing protein n=1 Tax=Acorus calamus TaxID=4465 RepID=A0AAV9ELY3_ACOCL|nr:hypothetical protein QJS10_CPA06g01909 [Acorus calamus]
MLAKAGPWGGGGGNEFAYNNTTAVRQIIINADTVVDCWILWNVRQGGSGGTSFKIVLDYPVEFLTKIEGYHDGRLIKSLTFYTNVGTRHGPYGTQDGTSVAQQMMRLLASLEDQINIILVEKMID